VRREEDMDFVLVCESEHVLGQARKPIGAGGKYIVKGGVSTGKVGRMMQRLCLGVLTGCQGASESQLNGGLTLCSQHSI
jgi:hypothetical protein